MASLLVVATARTMLSRYIRAGGCNLGALTSKAADVAGAPFTHIYYISSLIVHRSIGPGVCTLPLPPSSCIYIIPSLIVHRLIDLCTCSHPFPRDSSYKIIILLPVIIFHPETERKKKKKKN